MRIPRAGEPEEALNIKVSAENVAYGGIDVPVDRGIFHGAGVGLADGVVDGIVDEVDPKGIDRVVDRFVAADVRSSSGH